MADRPRIPMDVATLLGVVLALLSVLISIVLAAPLAVFFDWPSLLIVLGGSFSATLVSFNLSSVAETFRVLRKTLNYPLPNVREEIARLVSLANLARREGLLALEDKVEEIEDEYEAAGLRMVIDGLPAESIRDVMENEIHFQRQRHESGKAILETLGASAPAFGMMGTLIGLVAMLRTVNNPSSIGLGMAIALLTTLYGSFFANVFFLPLAGKLERRSREETQLRLLILEGVLSIQSGDKPQLVEQKLGSFLAPTERPMASALR